MLADLFNLAGFMLPNPNELSKADGKKMYVKFNQSIYL
jgi:hypothetical protein